jgi:glutathione synthase/RimK-type ligase-like ATP-grasp enzyme
MRVPPYPEQALYVSRVCAALGLSFTDLDGGNGYLFSVSNGTHRFVSGAGAICAYPLNSASAYAISRDKAHTAAVLAASGIPAIPGQLFFVTEHFKALRPDGREAGDAVAVLARAGKAMFCKPNMGARGDFAEIVADVAALRAYIERVRSRYDAILLQPVVDGDEYRVFCIDGDPVFVTAKAGFSLTGDGRSTLAELLAEQNEKLAAAGISPSGEGALPQDAGIVPAKGETIALRGRRNLSAGGAIGDFSTDVPAPLAEIARRAADAVGLRVSGVDVFDISPARDLSDLVVIEVNGNPSIASLSRIGRDDLVDAIWGRVIRTWFAERPR